MIPRGSATQQAGFTLGKACLCLESNFKPKESMPNIKQLKQALEWSELPLSSEAAKQFASLFFNSSKSHHEIDEILSMLKHESKPTGDFSRKPANQKLWKKHAKYLRLANECHNPFLKKMPYEAFLKTPYWTFIRMAKILEVGERCEKCGLRYLIQVHHLTYEFRGSDHKRMDLLVVLCDTCHKKTHKLI